MPPLCHLGVVCSLKAKCQRTQINPNWYPFPRGDDSHRNYRSMDLHPTQVKKCLSTRDCIFTSVIRSQLTYDNFHANYTWCVQNYLKQRNPKSPFMKEVASILAANLHLTVVSNSILSLTMYQRRSGVYNSRLSYLLECGNELLNPTQCYTETSTFSLISWLRRSTQSLRLSLWKNLCLWARW